MKRAKHITKLDLRWGYYNVRIKEGDEWKAAFRTSTGLYVPTVMMFRLCNVPATFQKFVNEIFAREIADSIVVIYLDDILIFSETEEDHERDVTRVFEILDKYDLFLRPSKCEFDVDTVKFL